MQCSNKRIIPESAEVGDYDPQDHGPDYVSQFKMLPKQTMKHEEKIVEAHKALR